MRSLAEKFVRFNHLQAIGVLRREQGNFYFLLKTQRKGTSVEVVATYTYTDIHALAEELNTKIPVILVVDGKGVLNKKIDSKNESDMTWLANLDFGTICHTTLIQGAHRFMGFCRRNVMEDEISSFRELKLDVLGCYVGPVLSALIKPGIDKETIFSNEAEMTFKANELQWLAKSESAADTFYQVGKTTLGRYHLPLYGAVVAFYTRPEFLENTMDQILDYEEIVFRKLFNVAGTAMLIVFFVMLLASYLLTWHYNNLNAALNLKNLYTKESNNQILQLTQERDNRLRILRETGFASSWFTTSLAYELAASVPAELKLSRLEIYPLMGEVKDNHKVEFVQKSVVVAGETTDEAAFNAWIKGLGGFKWIARFEITSFKKDKNNNSHFEIQLTLKDV